MNDLLLQCSVVTGLLFFIFVQLALNFFQRLGDWFDQLLNSHLALFQVVFGLLLLSLQVVFCEDEELVLGGFERIGGERLKGVGESGLSLIKQCLFFLGGFELFRVDGGLCFHLRMHHQPGDDDSGE